ncbi:MAG: transglutaminase domain-containing protein [Deltaproteobacteria bacterium]|nr:transglutaminase domain-containing protein [Deltaproteobacteria bacterium]
MKTPLFLLGVPLLFWGWQTGQLAIAALMAIVLEGSGLVKLRWNFSASDVNRISDFCTIVIAGMLIYLLTSNKSFGAVLIIFKWLPVALFPLVICQVYSASDTIDISALFLWTFRKRASQMEEETGFRINLTYPYLIQCVISTSAANVRTVSYYAGVLIISTWSLWTVRSKRFSPVIWVFLLILVGTVGYAGHIGLQRLQFVVEDIGVELFSGAKDIDPFKRTTAIGDIGDLKRSGKIIFRVKPASGIQIPFLLREASYNFYRSSTWYAAGSRFSWVQHDTDPSTWTFQPKPDASETVTISDYLRRGKGILKLPNGTYQISDLPVLRMRRNAAGTVKVEDGPGFVSYRVKFSKNALFGDPPDDMDLKVPQKEKDAILKIQKELHLQSELPLEIINSISSFFQKDFKYSLFLSSTGSHATPLADFLLKTRSGHCEYFATATVLLLRSAGIPARYVSGYSVQEFNQIEKRFVVRSRHAHAWAQAFLDGAWQDIDNTPAVWNAYEKDEASLWEPLSDIWSFGAFVFSKWRWKEKTGGAPKHVFWLFIPIVIIFGRKLYDKKKIKRVATDRMKKIKIEINYGTDSEFYRVEKRLIEKGFVRYPHETFSSWLKRIEEMRSASFSTDDLQNILDLHYQYRFDPDGISSSQKSMLASGVENWLEKHTDVLK